MRILGIDPGLIITGWGIIELKANALHYVTSGIIKPDPETPISHRLATILQGLITLMRDHQPHTMAIEETFVNRNPQSALKLGMARGVAMACPGLFGLTVGEYSANKIKKSLVGAGHATKDQMMSMVNRLLPQANIQEPNTADALAVAITHAHHIPFLMTQHHHHGGCGHDCKDHGHS